MMYPNDPKKNRRKLAARCISDIAIVIELNRVVYDILLNEQFRKERESLAMFLYS